MKMRHWSTLDYECDAYEWVWKTWVKELERRAWASKLSRVATGKSLSIKEAGERGTKAYKEEVDQKST